MPKPLHLPTTDETKSEDVRSRILAAAANLLASGGRDALTTRAVAAAANVQAPILYRQFGDKRGMLDALAEHGYTAYLAQKQLLVLPDDPVEALRVGWDLHVDFGHTHPALYLLMYAEAGYGKKSHAAEMSWQKLLHHIGKVAAAGRLRMSEERAANLFHAAATGTVLALLNMPQNAVDLTLSSAAREAAIAAITTEQPTYKKAGSAEAAVTLRATLDDTAILSAAELSLMKEWLNRLITSA